MNYYVTIQDVDNLQDELILHFAEKDSVSLKWLGGDDKTQTIIGSELNFSLLVDDCEEGKYDKYFTTDEQKWLVRLWQKVEEDTPQGDLLIWKGYLLPETYSEPYANKTFFVYFSAVDGLGLLKGKYLPGQYYEVENPVMDYIKEALKLTGLDYDIWFAPAIVNANERRWDKVYYDGLWNVDNNEDAKKKSAYEILDDLLYSMRCQLFQANGKWYIEGINKRVTLKKQYDIFLFDGGPVGNIEEANVKQLDFVSYPNIDLIPPYKEITASHDREGLELPETLYRVDKTEFNLNQYSVQNYWIPEGWQYDDYRPMFYYNKENLFFENEAENPAFDDTRKFELRSKPYVLKGQRLKLNIAFKVMFNDPNIPPDQAKANSWLNTIVYRVSIGGNPIFFNHNSFYLNPESLSFNTSGEAEAELIFEVKESGALNVEIFEPWGDIQSRGYSGAYLTNLSLEDTTTETTDSDTYSHTVTIDENASKTQELELPVSQDLTALTPNFQLDYLRIMQPGSGSIITGLIHRIFEDHGTKYYSVSIQTAKLIEQFPESVYYRYGVTFDNYKFNNPKVIYNYEGGDEFVVTGIQEFPADTPQQFAIFTRKTREPQITRDKWIEWSNSFYGIEKKPYLQVAAEIEKELYEVPFLQIEGSCKNPVKINDFIRFRYKNQWRYLTVTDVEWNIGENESRVLLQEAMYNGNSIGLIPPFVFAGEDKTVANPGLVVSNSDATAVSINGSIVSYLWEQISGSPATITSSDSLHPMISGVTGTGNVFRLTVTDSNGNTASDTMEINTSTPVVLVGNVTHDTQDENNALKVYQLETSPALTAGQAFEFSYKAFLETNVSSVNNLVSFVKITKNNIEIKKEITVPFDGQQGPILEFDEDFEGSLIFRAGDTILIQLGYTTDGVGIIQYGGVVNIENFRPVDGHVTVNNIPFTMDAFFQDT